MEPVRETRRDETGIWPQILIMEDEPTVAQGLQMILKEVGYEVDLAKTGKEALDTFDQRVFDLLVADLRLPDIDGIEVIERVKKNRPSTEVIVITGYSTVSSAVKAMKLGAFDYLPKPFTEDEFKSAVEGALKGKQRAIEDDHQEAIDVVAPEPFQDLLPEEKAEAAVKATDILKAFKGRRYELIPMLQKVQDEIGFLPKEALQGIAYLTKLPASLVFGVATFYAQFRFFPAGKHKIQHPLSE